jgi:hypothetical protein
VGGGINGKSPADCYEAFRAHVGSVMAATVTPEPLAVDAKSDRVTLQFVQRKPVELRTRSGERFYFDFSQALTVVSVGRRDYRLRTTGYWYRLQRDAGIRSQALLRWEYDAAAKPSKHSFSRHHVQMAATVDSLDLNHLHVPTGRVPFEEVLRFLLHDLEIPPRSADWPTVLANSEKRFYDDFMVLGDYPHY